MFTLNISLAEGDASMNIKDIAKLAGVSTSTVSKVLNKKDRDISEATREKILQIVRKYQYVPYSKIRKNTYIRSYYIEVLLADVCFDCTELIRSIGRAASVKGYSIIINNLKENWKQIKLLDGKDVDGIIVVGDYERYREIISEIQIKQIPCVHTGGSGQKEREIPGVIYEEEKAAYRAVSYLIEKGHTNIGCVISESPDIVKGYQKALYESKIEFNDANIFREDIASDSGKRRLREWTELKNTAVLCSDEEKVICLYRIFSEKGIPVPEDVSIISLKDSKYLNLLKPSVTAVVASGENLGEMVMDCLFRQMEDRASGAESIYVPIEIKERESVKVPNRWQGQKIVVVGSLNLDVSISVPYIPTGGEAMIATGTTLIPGGKGANQAIGAAKLGSKVYMIGCLGNDSDGKELCGNLLKHKVRTDGIEFENTFSTGKAYINIPANDDGDSTIIVYPGANRALSRRQIKKYEYLFEGAKYCLLSLEIPVETAAYAAAICQRKNVKVILKPSGAEKIYDELLRNVTYFVPNEKELNLLVPGEGTVEEKAGMLCNRGVENVIVTLGKEGCYLKNAEYARHFPAAGFESVDTTGGADAFISALAVYLSENVPLVRAMGFATYSAGITVTRQGVQPAMPDRIALEMYQDMIMDTFKE